MVSFSATADIFPFFGAAAGLCGAAFLVDLTGAGRAGFLATGLCAGFFATIFFAGLAADFARTAGFGAGLRTTGFLALLAAADFFAAGFFATGLDLDFAILLTNIV